MLNNRSLNIKHFLRHGDVRVNEKIDPEMTDDVAVLRKRIAELGKQ